VLSALLALASSVFWGTADFLGGSTARRLPVTTVLVASSVPAVGLLLVVVPVAGGLEAPGPYLGWGIGYGAVGMVAIAAFYRALADGTMGVVAPIAATGVVVPVVVGLASGEEPALVQLVGILAALVGIVLASSGELRGGADGGRSVVLALVAALGFGAVLTFLERGSATSVGMTLLVARSCGLVLAVLAAIVRRVPVTGWRPHRRALVAMGSFDVLANATYAIATHTGLLSVVAVLASLYPVVTVLLARHVHHERLTRTQAAGVTAALIGVVLMASG
jgi:drug/metabolite transporter (DMT)-like permease